MNAKDLKWEDIRIGDRAFFEREISETDLSRFAELSGDLNPLHIDETYAESTAFKGRILHGMFLGALVSRLVGMELPGKRALLLDETLQFKKPARVGDTLIVSGIVAHKSEAPRIMELTMEIRTEKELLASGSVHVRVI